MSSNFPRFTVDVLDASGDPIGAGPLYNVISAQITEELDRAGKISVVVPADGRAIDLLSSGVRVRISALSGFSGSGFIHDLKVLAGLQPSFQVSGPDILAELANYNCGYETVYENLDIENYIIGTDADLTTLLGGTGWTPGDIESGMGTSTIGYNGQSRLEALVMLARQVGKHFRAGSTEQTLDFGAFGADSGYTIMNVHHTLVDQEGVIALVGDLEIGTISSDIENRLFVLGKNRFDMRYASDSNDVRVRSNPGPLNAETTLSAQATFNTYTLNVVDGSGFTGGQQIWIGDAGDWSQNKETNYVQSVAGNVITVQDPLAFTYPIGTDVIQKPQFYIQDDTSVSTYGVHEALWAHPYVEPYTGLPSSLEMASDILYDMGQARLAWYKDPYQSYKLGTIYGLPADLRVGDTVHLTYNGVVRLDGVAVAYAEIDDDFYVVKIVRSFEADGREHASLEIANVDRPSSSDEHLMMDDLADTRLLKVNEPNPVTSTPVVPGAHWPVTLNTEAETVLSLGSTTGQEIALDTQAANTVFAGPETGGDDYPAFRALIADDITDLAYAVPNLTLGVANAEGAADTVIRSDATILVFDATVPTTITPDASAATGSAGVAARRDHTHAITCAAPGANLTVATTNAEGSASNFARSDHGHGITSSSNPGAAASILASDASGYLQLVGLGIGAAPGSADLHFGTGRGFTHADGNEAGKVFIADGTSYRPDTLDVTDLTDLAYGTPNLTLSIANAAGAANTVMRTDATIALFDATVPTTITPDASAATGSAGVAARRDHTHAITCAAAGNITPDASAAEGSASSFARSDHTHGITCAAPGANLTVSTSNAEGSASYFARSDHSHAITSSSNPGAAASILATSASGYIILQSLGIGTTPAYKLDIVAPSGSNVNIIRAGISGITNGFTAVYTHATTSMTYIFSSGNVGIGVAPSHSLDVANDARISGTLYAANQITHDGDTDTYLSFTTDTTTLRAGGTNHFIVDGVNGYCRVLQELRCTAADIGMYSDAGGLTIKATWYSASGDIRTYGGIYAGSVGTDPADGWMYADGGLFVGDTLNGDQTIGITVNQGANDDEIFTLKSSDVAHGIISLTETDTFAHIKKAQATSGGVTLTGYKDADGDPGLAANLYGILGEAANTTKTQAGGYGIIDIWGTVQNGTTYGNMTADGNVLSVRTQRGGSTVCLFIVDEDGDLHVDGSTSLSGFDEYHDAELARALDMARHPRQAIRSRWDAYVRYNESTLVEAGILGAPLAQGGLINVTRLQQLHNGAIWQNHCAVQELCEALKSLQSQVALLQSGRSPL